MRKIFCDGRIVEAVDSKFGRRKYNKGHKVGEVLVLGCVERGGEKRLFLNALNLENKYYK
jgi:hypothetical protein